MGRWAQRTRGSGSISPLISMQNVSIQGSGQDAIFVVYNGAPNAGTFNAADFSTDGPGAVGIAVSQLTINSIRVDLDMAATGATNFTYSGTLPSVVHPQTIAF